MSHSSGSDETAMSSHAIDQALFDQDIQCFPGRVATDLELVYQITLFSRMISDIW